MTRIRTFLSTFEKTASITLAAKAANISRQAHYRRLERDPRYRAEFKRSEAIAAQALEDEAVRRAYEGYLEPLTFQGIPTGHFVRRYSDGLLMMLLRARLPERYRDKTVTHNGEVTHKGEVTLSHEARMLKEVFTLEELEEIQRRMDEFEERKKLN